MIIDGEKYACNSCIRGHRVSACAHSDREVFLIAKKGRPVKQCEHCRSARKDKSHHAKCDCGSKKHKDLTSKSEPINESVTCSCRDGKKCNCGIKSEEMDMRLNASLSRPTPAVKSKPPLTTSISDSKLQVLGNGHPKPCHRNNTHTQCAPYKIPQRPHSLHGPSSFLQGPRGQDDMSRSVDDLRLQSLDVGFHDFNPTPELSPDSFQRSPFASTFTGDLGGFEFPSLISPEVGSRLDGDGSQIATTNSGDALSASMGWYDPILSTVTEAPGDFSVSATGMLDFANADWGVPSASLDFFSPSDLPLVRSQPPDFSQPISHSGESSYQSAPALTTSSSGAQSEIGDSNHPSDGDASGLDTVPTYWSHTVQFRESTPLSYTHAQQSFTFPQSVANVDGSSKRRNMKSRHRQTYSAGSNHPYQQVPHLMGSSDFNAAADNQASGVNIGHLQNLASLAEAREAAMSSSRSSPIYSPVGDGELRSITIPASIEDGSINDDWYFPLADPPTSATSTEFAWLS